MGGAYPLLACADLARYVSRIVVFVQPDSPAPAVHPALAVIVDIVPVFGVQEFHSVLNRVLHPFVEAGTKVLFVTPDQNFEGAVILRLLEALDTDPLYGFALPRTNVGGSAPIPRRAGDTPLEGPESLVPFLSMLPATTGGGIVHGTPVLVSADVLYNFGQLEGATFNLTDTLAALFIRANRRGYSAVVANQALVFTPEPRVFPGMSPPPQLERASDLYKACVRQKELPEQRFEALLWHRMKPKQQAQILFDIRNLTAGFNGTAQYILSLLKPLCVLGQESDVGVHFLVSSQAAEFHELATLVPGKCIFELGEDDFFDACVRLSQPWSFSELKDQARHSTVNLYLIMDAIAWDCHYIRMPHIDGVWRTAAAYADGLIFISEYARRSFHERFRNACAVRSAISYCSLDPAEYFTPETDTESAAAVSSAPPYILVVGNRYYHKGLHETVRIIATGFPEIKIKVLGEISTTFSNVEQLPSGMIPNNEIDRLFRECACLVFPSYYEGFGLPILKALSFNKTVIARHSRLLDEIRKNISPIGGIVPFKRKTDLLRAIGSVMSQSDRASLPNVQTIVPERLFGWHDAARVILGMAHLSLEKLELTRCFERLEFFYSVDQFDVERVGWTNTAQNEIIFEIDMVE